MRMYRVYYILFEAENVAVNDATQPDAHNRLTKYGAELLSSATSTVMPTRTCVRAGSSTTSRRFVAPSRPEAER